MLYVVSSICLRVANKFYLLGTEGIAAIHSTPLLTSHFFSFCHWYTLFSWEDSYINATEPKKTNTCFSHPMDNAQVDRYGLRIRPFTTPYTTVYILFTLRIRPFFAVLHDPVLRSYISAAVYGEIRRPHTERLRSWTTVFFPYTVVNDRLWKIMVHWPCSFPVLCQSLQKWNRPTGQ
jgi:hypothetical protein